MVVRRSPSKLLSRQERIKYSGLFQQAYTKGSSIHSTNFRLTYTKTLPQYASALPLVGFVVSKNYSKLAVDRNRIKRQMREVYRIYRSESAHREILKRVGLLVISVKPESKFDASELKELFQTLLERLS